KADDEPLDFMVIRDAIGLREAIWCLKTQDYRHYCLFLADCMDEIALSLFEAEYEDKKAPREAIKAIREWHNGDITTEQLKLYASAAYIAGGIIGTAAHDSTLAIAYAAYADIGSCPYCNAPGVTRESDDNLASNAIDAVAYATSDYKSNWKVIDKLFIKHLN
ncbi:MAG: hypothetical protein GY829_15140, partial [Gammaproteobacteria bacterium]|nr:hypothetical protein [Gammaproteobacteria bacterium]